MSQILSESIESRAQLNNISISVLSTIIDCLQLEELENLDKALSTDAKYQNIEKIVKFRIVFMRYLNKADRSYFFSIFSLSKFKADEGQRQSTMALQQNSSNIIEFPGKFDNCISLAIRNIEGSLHEEMKKKLEIIFTDPCIPMPKLMR